MMPYCVAGFSSASMQIAILVEVFISVYNVEDTTVTVHERCDLYYAIIRRLSLGNARSPTRRVGGVAHESVLIRDLTKIY